MSDWIASESLAQRGYSLDEVGIGWANWECANFVEAGGAARMRDINGDEIDKILKKVGWQFKCVPVCSRILDANGNVVALGWAALISSNRVNLSYATTQGHEGRGLAAAAVSMALTALFEDARLSQLWANSGEFNLDTLSVQAQFDSENLASRGVARRLGLEIHEDLGVRVKLADGLVQYLGASAPLAVALRHANQVLLKAGFFEADANLCEPNPAQTLSRVTVA